MQPSFLFDCDDVVLALARAAPERVPFSAAIFGPPAFQKHSSTKGSPLLLDFEAWCFLLARLDHDTNQRARLIAYSLLAQPRDEGACPGELSFIICRAWRIAAIAHRFKRLIDDLAECGLGHGGVCASLHEEHQHDT
jgi:hypothetical protein